MKGLSYDELFPGRFLKAGILKGKDVTLTISGVRIEDLPSETGGMRTKGILAFEGKKLELVLNRTNGEAIKAMFGSDTGDWIGKRITLFPSEFNGDPCLRVRGSPDLSGPLTFELRLPRKRPVKTTLIPTGKKPAATSQAVTDAAAVLGGTVVETAPTEVA